MLHNHGRNGIWHALCCALDPSASVLQGVRSYWKLHTKLVAQQAMLPVQSFDEMCIKDMQFSVTFTRFSRYLSMEHPPTTVTLCLDGARSRTQQLCVIDPDSGAVVDYDPGCISAWEVPHEALDALGWACAADAHRAADQWARLKQLDLEPLPVVDGPIDFEQMRRTIEEQTSRVREAQERLQDAEAPVSHVMVSVRAFHVPTQRTCQLVELQPVLRRESSPYWGRVQFRDERLVCTSVPPSYGDIHTRCGLRNGWWPFVSITLDLPSDVSPDDEHDDPNPANLWRSSVEGRGWRLSLGIVGRPEEDVPEAYTMWGPPSDRRLSETVAEACLQNALNWRD